MSDAINSTIETTLQGFLKTEEVNKLFRQEVVKFMATSQWDDMLYDSILDTINSFEIMDSIEIEIRSILLPRIRKALESI